MWWQIIRYYINILSFIKLAHYSYHPVMFHPSQWSFWWFANWQNPASWLLPVSSMSNGCACPSHILHAPMPQLTCVLFPEMRSYPLFLNVCQQFLSKPNSRFISMYFFHNSLQPTVTILVISSALLPAFRCVLVSRYFLKTWLFLIWLKWHHL